MKQSKKQIKTKTEDNLFANQDSEFKKGEVMNKIYTYGIIEDTIKPQIYWEDFWNNDFHYIAEKEDTDWYIDNKAKIDSEYFVFKFGKINSRDYYYVYKTENNGVDIRQDKYGDYQTYSGVYALKKSDFDNDFEQAYSFAKQEMNYLNELKDSYFNEIRFRAYEYDQEKQKYVETKDYFENKLIQAHDLEEIMQEKDLTLKEKLIKIARDENILNWNKLDEYDFLQDPNSIVMSEKALLELPQELHPFIDKGLSEREKELNQEAKSEKEPLNSQDYWVVEFNEAFPEGGVKDYKGEVITQELVDELKKLDERICKSKPVWAKEEQDGKITLLEIPYFKFYFDHIVDGEVIDRGYKILIGDGNELNKHDFQFLYEQVNKEYITENNQEAKSEKEPEQQIEQQVKKQVKCCVCNGWKFWITNRGIA
ncbi:Uncharacterised protein [Mycoplasmopsis bovigenitalium]|uniref:Uncharacterized protein n=2 Tax=Mycoplasmopsis bovigenitalium TaxID=2112 RepID=A0A449A972_9BACT|nr:Uncharacterised protein [Mycoplasmopsis bovigenitalium]